MNAKRLCPLFLVFLPSIACANSAVYLLPGQSTNQLTGASVIIDPTLDGAVIAQSDIPFTALTDLGPNDPHTPLFQATLRATVVRENVAGTLDFYYQVINPNNYAVDPFQSVSLTGFAGFDTSPHFAFEPNGPLTPNIKPLAASRDASGDIITFSAFSTAGIAFGPNEQTEPFLVRTNASAFSLTSTTTINFAGIDTGSEMPPVPAFATFTTFGPAPVPEPSTLSLLPLALIVLAKKLSRRS